MHQRNVIVKTNHRKPLFRLLIFVLLLSSLLLQVTLVRAEGAIDDDEDFDWPVWAGVLPLEKQWQAPQQNADQSKEYPLPTAPNAK